jgi:hypothetical protein
MPGARTQRARNLSRTLRAGGAAPAGPELISGINVTIKGRELAVRIGERIRWHRERADVLIQQMKKLVEVERSSAAYDLLHMLGRYESPRALMEERLRHHEERAVFLAFVRDHLTLDAVYRLDSSDLKVIDVLPH